MIAMQPHELHKLRHPNQHLPEILTGHENAARHLVAEILNETAHANRILMRPSWGIEEGIDQDDLADAAGNILASAASLYGLMNPAGPLSQIVLDAVYHAFVTVEHPTAELFPFRLSTILSVVTRKVIVRPDSIEALLQWMTGDPTIALADQARSEIAADYCAAALLDQYPKLDTDLPAVPAVTDADTIDRAIPTQVVDWLRKLAVILGSDDDDPALPVRQLDRDTRRSVQHCFENHD